MKKYVVEQMEKFADEEYQARSWFGIGPEVGSNDEMFHSIDGMQAALLEEGVSEFATRYFKDFASLVEGDPYDDPWEAYHSPEWIKIRLMAKVIAARLRFEWEL